MTEIEMLLASMDEAFDKKSWHGTNLRGSLRGVTAEQAARRPCPGRHNIWEVALHAAYWKYVVRRRLTGEKRGSFELPGSNWFTVPEDADAALWKRHVALLVSAHKQLRATVAGLSPRSGQWQAQVYMIRGIAAHDLYHAGQIQLLKRLIQ